MTKVPELSNFVLKAPFLVLLTQCEKNQRRDQINRLSLGPQTIEEKLACRFVFCVSGFRFVRRVEEFQQFRQLCFKLRGTCFKIVRVWRIGKSGFYKCSEAVFKPTD